MPLITGKIPNGCCSPAELIDGVWHVSPAVERLFYETGDTNAWQPFYCKVVAHEKVDLCVEWPRYDPAKNHGSDWAKGLEPFVVLAEHIVYTSPDAIHWERLENVRRDGFDLYFSVEPDGELYVSVMLPYTAQAAEELRLLAEKSPYAEIEEIGPDSLESMVPIYTCTDFSVPTEKKFSVWIQAAQHPCENAGAQLCDNAVRFLLSDDPEADVIRKKAIFHIVPVVSVGNWLEGRSYLTATRVNPNRDWGIFALPETRAIDETIRAKEAAGERFAVLFDLHTGVGGDKQSMEIVRTQISPDLPGQPDVWARAERLAKHLVAGADFPPYTLEGWAHGPTEFAEYMIGQGRRNAFLIEIGRGTVYDRSLGHAVPYTDAHYKRLGKEFVLCVTQYAEEE